MKNEKIWSETEEPIRAGVTPLLCPVENENAEWRMRFTGANYEAPACVRNCTSFNSACSIATKLQTLSKPQVFCILDKEQEFQCFSMQELKKKALERNDTSNKSKTFNTNPLVRGMTPATRAKQPTRMHLCQ